MPVDQQIVLCTVPDRDTADRIAGTLVTEQLAACVNIIPGITSVYRWKNRIEKDAEYLLLIKTHSAVFDTLQDTIKKLHPYELPEVIAVPIKDGLPEYLDWISTSLVQTQ
ncbi:MAG: divalent-cation tolerance protein CutA [Gammaproteobacteria bacterium]|nr:MAG: divalent-cation tolerance protein CutA [Gammaproteobacteria bacterium]